MLQYFKISLFINKEILLYKKARVKRNYKMLI